MIRHFGRISRVEIVGIHPEPGGCHEGLPDVTTTDLASEVVPLYMVRMRQAGWTATPARTEPARGIRPTHRAVDESRGGPRSPPRSRDPATGTNAGGSRCGRAGAATTQVGAVEHGVRGPILTTTGPLWTGGSSSEASTHLSAPSMRRGGRSSFRPPPLYRSSRQECTTRGPSLCECDRSSATLQPRIPLFSSSSLWGFGPRAAGGDGFGRAGVIREAPGASRPCLGTTGGLRRACGARRGPPPFSGVIFRADAPELKIAVRPARPEAVW